ncbi:MAG: hypothetical protein U5J97_11650 [Trueperaceae bacterium]|nr:hypothetical protein [Trueperaceae bacterium]
MAFRVTLSAQHGTLTLFDGSAVSGDRRGSDELVLVGTLDDVGAALAAGVTFTPAPDFNDLQGAARLDARLEDQGNVGSFGALLEASRSVDVAVEEVNDVPTVTDLERTMDEDRHARLLADRGRRGRWGQDRRRGR